MNCAIAGLDDIVAGLGSDRHDRQSAREYDFTVQPTYFPGDRPLNDSAGLGESCREFETFAARLSRHDVDFMRNGGTGRTGPCFWIDARRRRSRERERPDRRV